jgi:lysophospholipase L1-like esterase
MGRAVRRGVVAASVLVCLLSVGLIRSFADADVPPDTALRAWHAALADPTATADVLLLGDSIAEGYGASSRATWWAELVRAELQSHWGGAGSGYHPVAPASPFTFPSIWTPTGGRASSDAGIGLRSHVLTPGSGPLIARIATSRFDLVYGAGPTGGVMQVSVDGQVVARVDTTAPEGETRRWSSGTLVAGEHIVTVDAVASPGDAPRRVVVEGLVTTDATEGVRVWNGGHAGFGTSHFAAARGWERSVALADPELVIVTLGTNDYSQVTATEFAANLSLIVDRIRAAASGPVSIALMPMWKSVGRESDRYEAYVLAQRRLAEAEGLALMDLSRDDARILTDDGKHPNDAGQRAIADAVLRVADPRYQR